MRNLALAVGLVVMIGTTPGCSPRGNPAATPPTPAKVRPRSTASVAILEPKPGAVITGTKAQVRLTLTGGRIIKETTTRLAPDEGHIHLLIDGKVVSMTYGLDQEVEVTPGTHLLQAEYVANDHFPFNPRVISVSTFIVQ